MSQLNVVKKSDPVYTHEGGKAKRVSQYNQLRRSVMACLLWENTFYEGGTDIATRISELSLTVTPQELANLAIEARTAFRMRHVPLLLLCELIARSPTSVSVSDTIAKVIQRPDEITELLAMYAARNGRPPNNIGKMSRQLVKGTAKAFHNFDEYQFAKYNKQGRTAVTFRDAIRLTHPKPVNEKEADLFKRIAKSELRTPNTWETRLSAGEDKKSVFTELLLENKLGYMALLRNLRNMQQADVSESLIRNALIEGAPRSKALPFRFIAAAQHAPHLEDVLEQAMFASMAEMEKLTGTTAIVVDCSGSMTWPLSNRGEMTRMDAAIGLAMLVREIAHTPTVWAFGSNTKQLAPRRGFGLRDLIKHTDVGHSTMIGDAIRTVNKTNPNRIIIVTDEQSHDNVPDPLGTGYVINVASYKNGIGYGKWNHIDGFSEATVRWIQEYER